MASRNTIRFLQDDHRRTVERLAQRVEVRRTRALLEARYEEVSDALNTLSRLGPAATRDRLLARQSEIREAVARLAE